MSARWLLLVPLLLAACQDKPLDSAGHDDTARDSSPLVDTEDSGDPATELDLALGAIADVSARDGAFSAELVQPGTYVAILVSTDETRGATHAYGGATRRLPAPPPPDLPHVRVLPVAPPVPVEVGDEREFTVSNGERMVTITAEAVRVTDEIVLWEDRSTPNEIGSVDAETVDAVLASLEAIVLPRERVLFGMESDVDGDGKIAVLLSYTVNQYGAQAYVSWCDIGLDRGCGSSTNGGEIVYMGIPDPDSGHGSANGIVETVAHEFAHLIYAWHKFILLDQPDARENVYVTEGMSALAQDLTGYNNGNQWVWGAALDLSDLYGSRDYSVDGLSVNDLLRGSATYSSTRDGTLRGGAYLLLRYIFEQQGGMEVLDDGDFVDLGGIAWLHRWFDGPELGPDAVEATQGVPFWDLILDWYTALEVTGRDLNPEPLWNYQDRVEDPLTGYAYGVDPYARLHGGYSLHGPLVQPLDEADGSLRAGGVEYLQFTTDGGPFSLAVDETALARMRIFRVE